MGAYGGGWSRTNSLSACYLLGLTFMVMVLIFAVEDVLFPTKCSTCLNDSGVAGQHRPQTWSNVLRGSSKKQRLDSHESWDRPGSEARSKVQVEIDSELRNESESRSNAEPLELGDSPDLVSESEISDSRRDVNVTRSEREPVIQDVDTAEPRNSRSNAEPEFEEGVHGLRETGDVDKLEITPDDAGVSEARGNGESQDEGRELQTQEAANVEKASSEPPAVEEGRVELVPVGSPIPSSNRSMKNPHSSRVWYYTHEYKHPEAKLRLISARDGAAPIRSAMQPREREISIVTQTSADRLHALETTCMTWAGALCVAVHVRLESEIAPVYKLLKEMHARVEENGRCRLDIQVVTEDGYKTDEDALEALYPVNALRNVALGMATTKLLFLLDADFKPSPGLHESLAEEGLYQELLTKATEEKQLFVVPAFEQAASVQPSRSNFRVPESMEELKKGWDDHSIDCFHCRKSPTGHVPTNFEIFFDSATTSPYKISYRDGFEPYVIGAADLIPLYDPRFRGYGENKVSHIYSCAAAGMGFQVVPNSFVFELPHPPSKAHDSYIGKHRDPDQRDRIIGLYRQFRNEIRQTQMKENGTRFREFLETLGSPHKRR